MFIPSTVYSPNLIQQFLMKFEETVIFHAQFYITLSTFNGNLTLSFRQHVSLHNLSGLVAVNFAAYAFVSVTNFNITGKILWKKSISFFSFSSEKVFKDGPRFSYEFWNTRYSKMACPVPISKSLSSLSLSDISEIEMSLQKSYVTLPSISEAVNPSNSLLSSEE